MKWEDRFLFRTQKLKRRIEKLQKKQDLVFNIRLALALLIFTLLVVAVLFPKIGLELPVLTIGIIVFAYFVIISSQLKVYRLKIELLADFYSRQRARLINSPSELENLRQRPWLTKTPLKLSDEAQQLSRDFDIFGAHSLWLNISEAFSSKGEAQLLTALTNPTLDQKSLLQKQHTVLLASHLSGFLRKFITLGFLGQTEFADLPLLESEIRKTEYTTKNEKTFWFLVLLWLAAGTELFIDLLYPSIDVPVALRLIFPLLSLITMRSLSDIYSRAQTISILFSKLTTVLRHLDKLNAKNKSELLPYLKKQNPLKLITQFDRNLSFLTVNSHPLVVLVLNFIFPWNYFFTRRLEQARKQLALDLPLVLDEMGELEVISTYAFLLKYRETTFAHFSEKPQVECEDIFHPIGDTHFVRNTVSFSTESLVLLTGSNMSGKSTFMRTLGTNHILALAGAPVFAKKLITFVGPILSCIRVSDSLRDGASYFYAEVRRLKLILEKTQSQGPIFFMIDEIFKGTNNLERFLGSRELILYLSKTTSFGLISTHDIELSKLADSHIRNWHFSDIIKDQKLYFSYKIQTGPSPSTNALKIMEMEGLPVPKD